MQTIDSRLVGPYSTILAAFLIYIMSATAAVIIFRKNPEIKQRNLSLILVIAGANILLALLYYMRPWYNNFPCLLSLWIINVAHPAILLAQVFSGLRLILFYRLNELKICRRGINTELTKETKGQVYIVGNSMMSLSNESFLLKYRRYFTDQNISFLMLLVLLGMLLFNIIVQSVLGWWDKTPITENESGCPSQSIFKIPLYVVRAVVFYVINPLLIYASWDMIDGYGIRKHIILSQSMQAILFILALVWEFYVIVLDENALTTGEIWGMAMATVDFNFFVFVPAIRALRLNSRRKKINNRLTRTKSKTSSHSRESSVSTNAEEATLANMFESSPDTHPNIFDLIEILRASGKTEKPPWDPVDTESCFRKVLGNSYYRAKLLEEAAKSFCPENMMFFYAYIALWRYSMLFKTELGIPNGESYLGPWDAKFEMPSTVAVPIIRELYQDTFNAFFTHGADFELNIPSNLRIRVQQEFEKEELKINVFDEVNTATKRMVLENTYKKLCSESRRTSEVSA